LGKKKKQGKKTGGSFPNGLKRRSTGNRLRGARKKEENLASERKRFQGGRQTKKGGNQRNLKTNSVRRGGNGQKKTTTGTGEKDKRDYTNP